MILFEKDWDEYPSAIAHYDTKNKSFIKYHSILKAMGVKNNLWPLALIHKELRNIDPYSQTLTEEEIILIALECKINPWYFFREIARGEGNTNENPIYFRGNRSNMAVYWLYFNHISVCLEQIRQSGKTYGIQTLDAYILNIAGKKDEILLLTKDDSLRDKTISKIKDIQNAYPPYLKQHLKTDVANTEEIKVSRLGNSYKGLIARNDTVAASKIGRGHVVANIRGDEFAFLFFVSMALSSMLPASNEARNISEIKGTPYGNIFASTAGKKDSRDGLFAYNYFHDSAPWTEFFFESENREKLVKAVRSASKDGVTTRVHCVFNHRQLGYTDEWLEETARSTNSFGEDYLRDYRNVWTSGSQNSPFSAEDSQRARDSEEEVAYGEISKYGQIMIRWYIKENNIDHVMGSEYTILAVDTSDAMGKDDFGLTIRSLKTGDVLAVASINEINLITVANFIIELIVRFSKMTTIIERRNQAATLIDFIHRHLINLRIDPFKRLYNTCIQNHDEFPERYKEIQDHRNNLNENFLATYKKYFGFATSGNGVTSRSELYSTCLRQAIKYTADKIRDKQTINQLLSLVNKNGRVDHEVGGHDDLCVTWLLSYWFMTYGKNLQYYGIPHSYIMSSNLKVNSVSNREELYQKEINRRAKDRIEFLINQIKSERDNNIVDRLLLDIQYIRNQLGPNNDISITVDDMINQLKNQKSIANKTKTSIFKY